jgi:hypothetical protein
VLGRHLRRRRAWRARGRSGGRHTRHGRWRTAVRVVLLLLLHLGRTKTQAKQRVKGLVGCETAAVRVAFVA